MARRYDNENGIGPAEDVKPLGEVAPRRRAPKSKAAQGFEEVLTGDILTNRRIRRWYPVALYAVGLIFVFIAYSFWYQYRQRTEIQVRMEMNAERSRSMVFSSLRMNASRHSNIVNEVRRRGLKLEESTVPPKKVE